MTARKRDKTTRGLEKRVSRNPTVWQITAAHCLKERTLDSAVCS